MLNDKYKKEYIKLKRLMSINYQKAMSEVDKLNKAMKKEIKKFKS